MPTRDQHTDPVDLLRLGLWGETDDATLATARHAATCDACAAELAELRRIRDLLRALRGAEPSPVARAAAARVIAEHAVTSVAAIDVAWLIAVPMGPLVGVRSMGSADRVMRCEDGDLEVDVAMHAAGEPGRWDLTGQVLLDGAEPGTDLVVTLFLDRVPAGAARTDRYGEFALTARGARHIGVRVAGRGRPRHVELWREVPAAGREDDR